MPKLIAFILVIILGAAAGGGGFVAWTAWQERGPETRPEFTLPDLEGEERSISEWDGHLVVLNFWGSWCPPCVQEIPMFMELQDEYEEQGVRFVGVAMDREDDAREFYAEFEVNYPSLIGVQAVSEILETYGNSSGTLPYTVIINEDGHIVHRFAREITREELEPVINAHL